MTKKSFLLRLLLEWVLICIGVLSAVYCLTTAFHLPMPAAVRILVPVLALAFCLLFQDKPGKYYALGVLGLFAVLGWLFRKELWEGLCSLWGTLFQLFGKAYSELAFLEPKEVPIEAEAIDLGLTVMAVLETYLCSLAVRLWKRTTPCGIALLLTIAPCFVLTDTPPALFPLLAAVFALLTLAFSQSARRRPVGEHNKATVLSALLSAALLGVLLLLFPEQTHTPPITWEDLSAKMARWEEKQNNQGNVNAGLSGNPDQIDLSALGALPNRPITVLYATSSEEVYAYLRGTSYGGFDGLRWTRGERWPGGGSPLFPYLGRASTATLKLETVNREAVLYTTYQITKLPGGWVFADSYVENSQALTSYSMSFIQEPGLTDPDPDYDAWVRAHYLEVPDRTREGVLAWWSAQTADGASDSLSGSDGGDGNTSVAPSYVYTGSTGAAAEEQRLMDLARQVAGAVSRTARYSRNPVRMPADKDFCTWFLNEAEEGYCVHYATTCAALLRSLGVPARYVSGYVSPLKANRQADITVLQAHAWVEIWAGGRWMVVEATPDNATEFTGNINPERDPPPETSERPDYVPTEVLTDPPPLTKPTVPHTDAEEPGPSDPEQTGNQGSPGGKHNPQEEERDLTALWVFLGIVGFAALLTGRRALHLRLRERRLRRAGPNERARLLYRYLLRLYRLTSSPVPPEAETLARKAAFSQHQLDPEELACLRQIYDKQCAVLTYFGFWKRIWCKYVLAVI